VDEFGGMDDMGGGGRSARTTPSGPSAADQRRAEQQQRQIETVTTELAAKRAELNALLGIQEDTSASQFLGGGAASMGGEFMMDEFGGMVDPMMMGGPGLQQPGQPTGFPTLGQQQPGQNFVNTLPERVRVWAQDLTVQPGRTYRYKVIVTVINPLFQYTRVATEQREINEFKLALGPSEDELAAMEWSPPVEVESNLLFFLAAANVADQINPARARVEVWRIFDGRWRQKEFIENPGNPIGGIETVQTQLLGPQSVDMHVGAVLLDIDPVQTDRGTDIRMIYFDEYTNSIQMRMRRDDNDNAKRKELIDRAEADEQNQVAAR
jgi:hypothetical protein